MSESETNKPLIQIDPKELMPAGIGFFIGLLILAGFFLLATVMGLPTHVESFDIPKQ